jgi:hypothetical protein
MKRETAARPRLPAANARLRLTQGTYAPAHRTTLRMEPDYIGHPFVVRIGDDTQQFFDACTLAHLRSATQVGVLIRIFSLSLWPIFRCLSRMDRSGRSIKIHEK